MLSVIGLILTALGTITAIIKPTIAGRWGDDETPKKELRLQIRYYIGIGMIVVGTVMQIVAALPALK